MKQIIKWLYKRNGIVRAVIDWTLPRLQELWSLIKDLVSLRLRKIVIIRSVRENSMLSRMRLSKVYDIAEELNQTNIGGSFVECGTYTGGNGGMMGILGCKKNRDVWLFDSFEGNPEPTEMDGERAIRMSGGKSEGGLESSGLCVAPEASARKLIFDRLNLSPDKVHIVKGWFQNEIPKVKDSMGLLSLVYLDGNWYESTKYCLETLYPLVVDGGYILIDDYGCWEGCRKATDEFRAKNNIQSPLIRIDSTGSYFQKR